MSFGPTSPHPRECAACHAAIPLATMLECPTCGHTLDKPGNLGAALVEAMTDVLGGPAGRRPRSG